MYQRVMVIDVDGISELHLNDDNLLDAIHDVLLGGYFEIVRCINLPKGVLMLVDDCGVLKNLPINLLASRLYGDLISGTAIIMREYTNADGEPDITGLNSYDFNRVLRSIHNVMFKGGVD